MQQRLQTMFGFIWRTSDCNFGHRSVRQGPPRWQDVDSKSWQCSHGSAWSEAGMINTHLKRKWLHPTISTDFNMWTRKRISTKKIFHFFTSPFDKVRKVLNRRCRMCWKGEASAIKRGKRYKPFFRIISTSSPPLLPTMHCSQWTFCHVWMMLHNLARKLGIPFEGINFEGGRLMSTPPIILYVVKILKFLRWMMKVAECGSSRNTTKSWKSHSSKSQVGLTYQFCKEAQILMQCIHLHCWASQMYHPNLDRGMALWSPQSGRHDRESWRQTPTRFTFYFSLLKKPEISKSKGNDNIYTEDITEQTLNHSFFWVEGTFAEPSANIEYVGHFWCLGQLQWSALCRDFPSVAIQVNLLLYWPVSALQSSQAAWSLRNLLRRETSSQVPQLPWMSRSKWVGEPD